MRNKNYIGLIFILLSKLGFSSFEEVSLYANKIHVPKGFDSNDDVELIITGDLPSTCYRRPVGQAKLIDGNINIEIKAIKIEEENTYCIMALVPYMISVSLGQLNEGSYPVLVSPGSLWEKKSILTVEQTNSNSIDDHTYANITSLNHIPNTNIVILSGYHPSSCMSFDRIELIANDAQDTISILPIIKQNQSTCDSRIVYFDEIIILPELFKNEVLLHVRKIDGTASNYLIN